MSILTASQKRDFNWAMSASLLETCKNNDKLDTTDVSTLVEGFTYEQKLNLVFNPARDERYLSTHVIESCVTLSSGKAFGLPIVSEAIEDINATSMAKDIKDDKETVYSAMKKVKPNERSKVLSALRDEGIVVEASDPDDSDETTPKKLIDKLETSKDSLPEELKESCGHKMNQLAKLLSHSVHTDNVVKDVTTITTPLSESNVLEFYTTKTKMKKWVKGNPNASKSLNEGLSSELALLTECYFIYKRHMSKSKNTENAILETLDFLDKGKDSYPAKQTMYENQIIKWLNRLAKV
jgi:hypothetical protein